MVIRWILLKWWICVMGWLCIIVCIGDGLGLVCCVVLCVGSVYFGWCVMYVVLFVWCFVLFMWYILWYWWIGIGCWLVWKDVRCCVCGECVCCWWRSRFLCCRLCCWLWVMWCWLVVVYGLVDVWWWVWVSLLVCIGLLIVGVCGVWVLVFVWCWIWWVFSLCWIVISFMGCVVWLVWMVCSCWWLVGRLLNGCIFVGLFLGVGCVCCDMWLRLCRVGLVLCYICWSLLFCMGCFWVCLLLWVWWGWLLIVLCWWDGKCCWNVYWYVWCVFLWGYWEKREFYDIGGWILLCCVWVNGWCVLCEVCCWFVKEKVLWYLLWCFFFDYWIDLLGDCNGLV